MALLDSLLHLSKHWAYLKDLESDDLSFTLNLFSIVPDLPFNGLIKVLGQASLPKIQLPQLPLEFLLPSSSPFEGGLLHILLSAGINNFF